MSEMNATKLPLTPASVWPVYSNGRRKFGRPPAVHHWEIGCELCPDLDLRPSPFWEPKKKLLAIAAAHNTEMHHA